MSYGQRIATYEQFVDILNKSGEAGFRYAPKPKQIDGLMDGVMVSLLLEEMSVDYADHIAKDRHATYVPRHRVHATILFDYGTYLVDVPDAEWFALPSVDAWQSSLPVLHLPSDVTEKALSEALGEPNEKLRKAAKEAKKRIRSGVPPKSEEGEPEYLDTEEDPEDGGAGVREPLPDDAPEDGAGAAVPLEAPVG